MFTEGVDVRRVHGVFYNITKIGAGGGQQVTEISKASFDLLTHISYTDYTAIRRTRRDTRRKQQLASTVIPCAKATFLTHGLSI